MEQKTVFFFEKYQTSSWNLNGTTCCGTILFKREHKTYRIHLIIKKLVNFFEFSMNIFT